MAAGQRELLLGGTHSGCALCLGAGGCGLHPGRRWLRKEPLESGREGWDTATPGRWWLWGSSVAGARFTAASGSALLGVSFLGRGAQGPGRSMTKARTDRLGSRQGRRWATVTPQEPGQGERTGAAAGTRALQTGPQAPKIQTEELLPSPRTSK